MKKHGKSERKEPISLLEIWKNSLMGSDTRVALFGTARTQEREDRAHGPRQGKRIA